jgi:two-component sensor histidine kinase
VRRLDIEWLTSHSLNTVQAHYKDIKHAVQATLDIHQSLIESTIHQGKSSDLERANAAVLDLEEKTASFDSTIRRLLHTVYLTNLDAWDYSQNLSQTIFGRDG